MVIVDSKSYVCRRDLMSYSLIDVNRKTNMMIREMRSRVKHQRKRKTWEQYIRHRARHLKVGTVIETCACDVARVIEVDVELGHLKYISLTQGGEGSCSIMNCGPIQLRPYAVKRRLALFESGGMKALTMRYYTEDCKMSVDEAESLFLTYEQLMEGADNWVHSIDHNVYLRYLVDDGLLEGKTTDPAFWSHYQTVRGKNLSDNHKQNFFSCSCD